MSPNVHWKRAQRSDRSCGKSARSSPSECCSYKRSGTQPKSLMRTDRPTRSGWQSLDWHRGSPKATLLTLQHHRQQVSTLQQKNIADAMRHGELRGILERLEGQCTARAHAAAGQLVSTC